jgi:hypothetical protein
LYWCLVDRRKIVCLCGESVCEECVGLGWVAGAGGCAAHAAQDLLKTGSRRRPWWSRAPRKCDLVQPSMLAVTRGLLGVLGYLTQHSPRVYARPVRVCVCCFFLTQHCAQGVRPARGLCGEGVGWVQAPNIRWPPKQAALCIATCVGHEAGQV